MAICRHCNKQFVGKRADAKFCSDVCRVIFNRNIKVESVTDNVTDNKQGITLPEQTDLGNTLTTTQTVSAAIPERTAQGNIRVSKPGDSDYVPMCETTRAFIEGRDKRPESGKRGFDIKCFGDLPADVQEVIHRLSTTDGKIDQTIKANRTAIAVNYQHQFPDRYHNTGMSRTDSTKGAGL